MKRLLLVLAACGDGGGDPAIDARPGDGPPPGTCETTAPWASAPAMPLGPTQETAVVAVGTKIYVIGGFNSSSQIIAAVQVFDTVACTWSMGPNLPMPIHHANAAVVDGTIYVLG